MPGERIAIVLVAPADAPAAAVALDLLAERSDVHAILLTPEGLAAHDGPTELVVTLGEAARAAWDAALSLGPARGTMQLHWSDPHATQATVLAQVQYLTERMLPGLVARRRRLGRPVPAVAFPTPPPMPEPFHGIVGTSPAMLALFDRIRTGTGKELVARAIHFESTRRDKPFVALNCGTLSLQLADSDLFGHVKGAFTGAQSNRKGLFERAQHGTVFLDEIGELPLEQQVKLLRVMQERCFEPVGSNRTVSVDVRVVCATHRDLQAGVQQGWFREDLFYRLNVLALVVPPLRERREDVPLLVRHALDSATQNTSRAFQPVEVEVLSRLAMYPWPGNVRELCNLVHRAAVLSSGSALNVHLLDPGTQEASKAPGQRRVAAGILAKAQRPHLDREAVAQALQRSHGNRSIAAELLGISRSTLYRLLDGPK
jgi:DNA-binding NtrC family response regulator